MEKVLVTADWQWPYTDTKALLQVLNYAQDLKPDIVIHIGDILDLPYLTTKYLRRHADPKQLLTDISSVRGWLAEFRKTTRRQVFINGNHEERLNNYIIECAPALEALINPGQPLNLKTLLDPTGKIITDFIEPWGSAFIYKSVVFTHGTATGKFPAAAELNFENSSGMSGHTHRLQIACKTDRSGEHEWVSLGCLCHTSGKKAPPGYRKGSTVVNNWQQGFGVVYFHKNRFQMYPVNIIKGQFISPEGNLYGHQ